ncbi:MAG TPA: hypothetical protein VHK01_13170 [Lacipirellulaceae bacterium]|nr:hypothetical protein [Lacipirellulaceae bacterium]
MRLNLCAFLAVLLSVFIASAPAAAAAPAIYNLGTLGGTYSYGYAVNDSGQVAGRSYTSGDAAHHAFRYTGTPGSGGSMADLGTLGGTNSRGYAVNDSGQVAGHSNTSGNAANHAFLYTGTPGSGGSMADLGTLGGTNSFGWAVNNAGQVAGLSYTTGNAAYHAFLYTGTPGTGGVMTDLDAWLDANNPTEGAKWTLEEATGINDYGLITGRGGYDDGPGGLSDGSRAFLLDASALSGIPGDFNRDGTVDAADYVVWRKSPSNFGGDPGGYNTWRANFGATLGNGVGGSVSHNAVPEGSSLVPLTLTSTALLRRWPRLDRFRNVISSTLPSRSGVTGSASGLVSW